MTLAGPKQLGSSLLIQLWEPQQNIWDQICVRDFLLLGCFSLFKTPRYFQPSRHLSMSAIHGTHKFGDWVTLKQDSSCLIRNLVFNADTHSCPHPLHRQATRMLILSQACCGSVWPKLPRFARRQPLLLLEVTTTATTTCY